MMLRYFISGDDIQEALTSVIALRIYFIIFCVIIIGIAVGVMISTNRRQKTSIINKTVIEGKKEPTDKQVMSVSDFPSPALHENVDAEEQSVSGSRFPGLGYIDSAYPELVRVSCDSSLTLESFCYNFRQYCAGELGLFWDTTTNSPESSARLLFLPHSTRPARPIP